MGKSNVKRENYITIQGFMITDLNLKGNELLIYAIIYGFSQTENPWFSGSRQYLADWTNSTKQGVQKCLNSLVSKGLINKRERYINNIRCCEYQSTKFTSQQSLPVNKVYQPSQQSCPNNIDNNINNNIHTERKSQNSRFEEFWDAYPKKTHKYMSERAYADSVMNGVKQEWLIDAAKEYALCMQGSEEKFISNPENWLKGNLYMDYPEGTYEKKKAEAAKNRSRSQNNSHKTSFNNFDGRSYDMNTLEAQLLNAK